MRYTRNLVRWSLCAVIVFGIMAIDVVAQAPSGDAAAQIDALEKQEQALQSQGLNAEAVAAYYNAAILGCIFCMNQLANIYFGQFPFIKGPVIPVNFAQAYYWFQKEDAAGRALGTQDGLIAATGAEREIGAMFSKGGPGLPADPVQARAWFQKAAAQGDQYSINALAQMNPPATQPAPAQPAAAPQQTAPQQGQGTCAAVYIVVGEDNTYGQHYFYGAAWSRSSYDDALAGAKSELMNYAGAGDDIDPRQLPDAGGQYAAKPVEGSGCTYAHDAVAGALKIAPSGGSMWNPGGAAGTSILGAGVYDKINASFSDSTDAAASAAISECQTNHVASGDNDHEICKALEQW
jgi:hypothetical protein